MKFMILGQGRHGKDTVGDLMTTYLGLKSISSSWFAADRIVFPAIKDKYGYETVEDCFEHRHDPGMRTVWFTTIKAYGEGDPARFSRELFSQYDIYIGIRNREEFIAARKEGLFDVAIWVDAMGRKGQTEDDSSCTVKKSDADIILDNNGTEKELDDKVFRLCTTWWDDASSMLALSDAVAKAAYNIQELAMNCRTDIREKMNVNS